MTRVILYFFFLFCLYFGGALNSVSYGFEMLGRGVWSKAANAANKFRNRSMEAWNMAAKNNMIDPTQDGISHINIYSRGKTELGRLLTNFAHTPFSFPPYGDFQSVEGFWYYFLTNCKHENLKNLHGFAAKKEGQKHRDDRIDKICLTEDKKSIILEAIRCKLRQNKHILTLLKESNLKFEHYYVFDNGVIQELPQYQWIVVEIERLRTLLKNHSQK